MIRFLFPFILSLMAIIPTKGYAFEVGETFPAGYVCKSEELVMQVAEKDAEDVKKAGELMAMFFRTGQCVPVNGHVVFVKEVLLDYKDSKGVLTQVLSVLAKAGPDQPTFYVIVTPKTNKT
jgi:hypothetical protein